MSHPRFQSGSSPAFCHLLRLSRSFLSMPVAVMTEQEQTAQVREQPWFHPRGEGRAPRPSSPSSRTLSVSGSGSTVTTSVSDAPGRQSADIQSGVCMGGCRREDRSTEESGSRAKDGRPPSSDSRRHVRDHAQGLGIALRARSNSLRAPSQVVPWRIAQVDDGEFLTESLRNRARKRLSSLACGAQVRIGAEERGDEADEHVISNNRRGSLGSTTQRRAPHMFLDHSPGTGRGQKQQKETRRDGWSADKTIPRQQIPQPQTKASGKRQRRNHSARGTKRQKGAQVSRGGSTRYGRVKKNNATMLHSRHNGKSICFAFQSPSGCSAGESCEHQLICAHCFWSHSFDKCGSFHEARSASLKNRLDTVKRTSFPEEETSGSHHVSRSFEDPSKHAED